MIAGSTANEKIVVFIGWILSFSRLVNSAIAGLKGLKTATGRSVLRPIQIRLTASSLVKSHQPVKQTCRKRESPLPIPERPSAFPPRAKRNVFRRCDAHQQSRFGINR
jgi:hypothetical protein